MTVERLDSPIHHLYEAETLHPITIYQSDVTAQPDEMTLEFLLQSVSCLSSVIPQVSTYRIRFQTVRTDISPIKDFLHNILLLLIVVMESDSILVW